MTKGEYLNTLDNKDKAQWFVDNDFADNYDLILSLLDTPHKTTADEDFAEIRFVIETTQPLYACYADDNGRLLYVLKNNNEYDTNNEGWNDELINTVRTIADKKRKELGWDK